mgnify:CR=1 FL=1
MPHWEIGEALGIIDFERGVIDRTLAGKALSSEFPRFRGIGVADSLKFTNPDTAIGGRPHRSDIDYYPWAATAALRVALE